MECYESDNSSNESSDLLSFIDNSDDDESSVIESDPLGEAIKPKNEGIKPYQFEPLVQNSIQGQDHDDVVQNNAQELHDNHRLTTTDWCSCSFCENMPTVKENLCCQEVNKIIEEIQEEMKLTDVK